MNQALSGMTCVALLSLAACGGSAASTSSGTTTPSGPALHAIRFVRTLPVGATWGELTQYVSTERQTTSTGGAIVSDTTEQTAIELQGDFTVVSLGPDGQPSRMRLVLDHVTVDTGAGPQQLVQLPSVLVIERGDPGSILGESGEPIADETVELLRHVLPERAEPVDTDAMFGTREPQAVGASWPIDRDQAAEGLLALHLTVDPMNLAGATTLVTVGREAGMDVLGLRAEVSATHVGLPGLPPGSVEQRADVRAATEMWLPSDTSIVALRQIEEAAVDVEVLVPTPGGGQATVTVVTRQRALHVRTPR